MSDLTVLEFGRALRWLGAGQVTWDMRPADDKRDTIYTVTVAVGMELFTEESTYLPDACTALMNRLAALRAVA